MRKILLIAVVCVLIFITYVFFFAGPKIPDWKGYPADHTALNVFNFFTLKVEYGQRGGAFCLPEEPQQLADELKNQILRKLEFQGYKQVSGEISKNPNFDKHPLALKIIIGISSAPNSKTAVYKVTISRSAVFDHFWNEKNLEKFKSEIFAISSQEFERQYRTGAIGSEYIENDGIQCVSIFSPNLKEIAGEIIAPIDSLWRPNPELAEKLEQIVLEKSDMTELKSPQLR